MVEVASSRSANTALPREQNQPGRRLAHAAQPTGACRAICFCRFWWAPEGVTKSAIILPRLSPMSVLFPHRALAPCVGQSPDRRSASVSGNETFALFESVPDRQARDVMGLTPVRGHSLPARSSRSIQADRRELPWSAGCASSIRGSLCCSARVVVCVCGPCPQVAIG